MDNKILEKLMKIQAELKCNKNQVNKFGGYNYRSCEDIFEAVKPLLSKYKCSLKASDELVMVGERYYIKATVTIYDTESNGELTNTAYAREEENKKGQDGSQITGTSSSYARKYALNGLFLIDDVKDADTNEYVNQTKADTSKKVATKPNYEYRDKVIQLCKEKGIDAITLSQKYKLTGSSTNEDFKKVYEEILNANK